MKSSAAAFTSITLVQDRFYNDSCNSTGITIWASATASGGR